MGSGDLQQGNGNRKDYKTWTTKESNVLLQLMVEATKLGFCNSTNEWRMSIANDMWRDVRPNTNNEDSNNKESDNEGEK